MLSNVTWHWFIHTSSVTVSVKGDLFCICADQLWHDRYWVPGAMCTFLCFPQDTNRCDSSSPERSVCIFTREKVLWRTKREREEENESFCTKNIHMHQGSPLRYWVMTVALSFMAWIKSVAEIKKTGTEGTIYHSVLRVIYIFYGRRGKWLR